MAVVNDVDLRRAAAFEYLWRHETKNLVKLLNVEGTFIRQ